MKKAPRTGFILITIFLLIFSFACKATSDISEGITGSEGEIVDSPLQSTGGTVPVVGGDTTGVDPQSQTWLVLFYLDADDPVLEEDMYFDMNEIEMVGSTDRVTMLAQMDRYEGAFEGDGNWSSTRRYLLTQDGDLETVNSQVVEDLGEVDMGSTQTLVDFATWGIQNYPADRVVLILSDHGSGWPGGWSDTKPNRSEGNWLYLIDIQNALSQIIANTGISQFEMIGMDACLMSMLEVYNGLAPYTHYAVASQETEPAMGWAYTSFLTKLVTNPEMSGAELSRAVVDGYINEDQRIVNDEARRNLLLSYGVSDPASAEELAQEFQTVITITAVDLTALPGLNSSLDVFVTDLKNVDQSKVAEARSYAQPFYNVFNDRYPSPYIDLANFADFVTQTTGDPAVEQSAQTMKEALSQVVIAEKHGEQRPGATGISVYFPVSELYWDENIGVSYYTFASQNVTQYTLWDDFLAYHYAGQDFGLGNPTPEEQLTAPGAAPVTISPLTISPGTIDPDEVVNIQTDITGDRVAYVYLVGLIKNNTSDRYLAFYIDYLQMSEIGDEVNGVVFPVYDRTDGVIHIDMDWNLAADGVCDANACVFALVNPDKFTTQPEKRLYYVEGWYVYADTGERVEAAMYFNNKGENLLSHIIANPVSDGASVTTPSEIIPRSGDQFITVNTVLTFDESGQFTGEYEEGNILTFGDTPLNFGTFGTPDPANYLVGIMVMDMDGNKTWQFAPVTVSTDENPFTPQDFPQEGTQQSEYYAGESAPVTQHSQGENSSASSGEGWQSSQAKLIRSPLIPLIGGVIGVLLALILGVGGKKGKPGIVQSFPVTPPPQAQPSSGKTTKPPMLPTAPPPLQTTPPPTPRKSKPY